MGVCLAWAVRAASPRGCIAGCASSTGNCDCTNGATARVASPRTVQQLVAHGLRQRQVPVARTAARVATTAPSSSHLGAWAGGTIAAMSLATTAYLLWTHAHPHRLDLAPYVAPDGGGLSVLGRF